MSNVNVWIVALCEGEESKRVTRSGIWKPMLGHAKNACVTLPCKERLKLRELGTPKQIWIAYHAPGMTAMLQLCFHNGASKAGSKYMSLALQRIASMQSTDAVSGIQRADA